MSVPLISCVMPTRGRPAFVRQAYRLWARSTWPEIELLPVVDLDDVETLALVDELAAADPRVRVVRGPPWWKLGEKRNAGVAAATGEYVASWDDDDWYSAQRLELQVERLIAGESLSNFLRFKFVLDLVGGDGYEVPEDQLNNSTCCSTHMFAR